MTEDEIFECLCNMGEHNRQRIFKRLEEVTPAGEHPRLVGEHAERAGNMEPTTSQGQSLRVGQTKVRVELERMLNDMRMEASFYREKQTKLFDQGKKSRAIDAKKQAETIRKWSRRLNAILEAEPSPPSEAEVVEEGLGEKVDSREKP